MPQNNTFICIPCRIADKYGGVCKRCGESMRSMGSRWSAPRKTNDRAWKRIEVGDIWWDKKKIDRANAGSHRFMNRWPEIVVHGIKMNVPRWGKAYRRYVKMKKLEQIGRRK